MRNARPDFIEPAPPTKPGVCGLSRLAAISLIRVLSAAGANACFPPASDAAVM